MARLQAEGSDRPSLGWLKLVRVTTNGMNACICSDEVVDVAVHWGASGSIPCIGKQCPTCEFRRARWYGFVGMKLLAPHGNQKVIVELPEGVVDRVATRVQANAGKGTREVWKMSRRHKRSQVQLAVSGTHDLHERDFVPRWAIWRTLAAVWSFPELPERGTDLEEWKKRMATVASVRLQALTTQIDRDLDACQL